MAILSKALVLFLGLSATTTISNVSAMGPQNCHTCDCFECGDVEKQSDGSMKITIEHCKGGDISWICCQGSTSGGSFVSAPTGCSIDTCGPAPAALDPGTTKCEDVADGKMVVHLPTGTDTFEISTHDGQTTGIAGHSGPVLFDTATCGGSGNQGGGCRDNQNDGSAHCVIEFDIENDCDGGGGGDGGVVGDPHIQLWNGDWYDFHGQCDLVFLHNPEFAGGLGMDIHIRTTIRAWFSFVESAAIRIGNDILEVSGWGEYLVNGVDLAEFPIQLAGRYNVTHTTNPHRPNVDLFLIELEANKYVNIQSFKDIVAVKIHDGTRKHFGGSKGLMGMYGTGIRLARDGKTVLENDDEFGQEWQVLESEPQLFEDKERRPQHPVKCMMPTKERPSPQWS